MISGKLRFKLKSPSGPERLLKPLHPMETAETSRSALVDTAALEEIVDAYAGETEGEGHRAEGEEDGETTDDIGTDIEVEQSLGSTAEEALLRVAASKSYTSDTSRAIFQLGVPTTQPAIYSLGRSKLTGKVSSIARQILAFIHGRAYSQTEWDTAAEELDSRKNESIRKKYSLALEVRLSVISIEVLVGGFRLEQQIQSVR